MDDKSLYDKMYEKTDMVVSNTSSMFLAEGADGMTSRPASNPEDNVMLVDPIVRSHSGHRRVTAIARVNGRTTLVTSPVQTFSESDNPPVVLLQDVQRIVNALKYHPNPNMDRIVSIITRTLNEILEHPLTNRQEVMDAMSRLYHNLTIL